MSTHDSCLGTALDDWLIELDQAGFHVGVRERLLVQSLFARLSASGELTGSWSVQDLLSLARPLLCTQADQQRRYTLLLATFVAQHDVGSGAGLAERGVQSSPAQKPWRFQYWQGIPAALLIGIVVCGVWWWPVPPAQVPAPDLPSDPLPSIPEKSEPKPEPTKLARPIYVPASSMPIVEAAPKLGFSASVRIGLLVLGGISLLSLAWLAWARWRRQLYLQGTRTDKEVEERLITDPNPVTIEPPPAILRLASRMMRQRYAAEREILDVPRTLRATMSAGGALLPRYRAITQTPEYLVLIDRRHPADHHAAFSEVLVAALKRNGVAVEVRYFEGSPQTGCWSSRSTMEGHEQFGATSFAELAGRFSGHRLLIFSDAQTLIDEVDGMPRSWATHLQAFPQRAWFTPMPMASWGQAELATDAQGFLVLPIQPESLNTMAGWFSSGQLGLEVGADWPVSYPTILRGESLAWVVRQTAPPPAALDDVLFQLRNYLGARRFQWLCACAIFPAISPAITLALGREITSDARELALGAAAIGALPWFRHAFMPAWLRLAVLNRLDEAHTTRFRQIVEERLATALEGGAGSPLLTLAERKRRLAAWFRRRSGAARDVVLVDFLHRGTLSKLAQRLPEGLRKRLFRQGLPAYGLTSGVLWLLPVGLLLGLLGLPGVWERVTLQSPVATPALQALTVFVGHKDQVQSAAFSPDGTRVVTASRDDTARLWDISSNKLLVTLTGHEAEVFSAVFSPDGRQVVTASEDKTARIWDSGTGKLLTTLTGHEGGGISATFSPDGKQVVTTSRDRTVRLWDSATGKVLAIFAGHEDTVISAAFSPDGKQVVTASDDKTARLWDSATGKVLTAFTGHQDSVSSAAFSPDGRQVVTASDDKTARLWDSATGKILAIFRDHEGHVNSAAFSPDGKQVVTASYDKTARLWDSATGKVLAIVTGHEDSVLSAVFSPDGKQVVTASRDETARLWGEPWTNSLDLLDCGSSQGVEPSVQSLADQVAAEVKKKTLPTLAPVAYIPSAWHPPDSILPPQYGVVLYGAEEGRATAEILAKWLSAEVESTNQAHQQTWKGQLVASLGSHRFVVNTCVAPTPAIPDQKTAEPNGTSPATKVPSNDRQSVEPKSKALSDLRVSVFGCSVAEREAKRIIASIIPAIERLGAKPKIQFVDETQRARFTSNDTGLNVRVTKNSSNELAGAQALLAQPEFKKTGAWKQEVTRQQSRNDLSVFVCPVNFSAAPDDAPLGYRSLPNVQMQSQGTSPKQNSEPNAASKPITQPQDAGSSHENLNTADALTKLAMEYQAKGNLRDAEPLLQKALQLNEQSLGQNHPDTATSLINLGENYNAQRRHATAELLAQRALHIDEAARGTSHPTVARDLNLLAELYASLGHFDKAEPLAQRALYIDEAALGARHPTIARDLNLLAELYASVGHFDKAEPFAQRALTITEKTLGDDHPETATSLLNLAAIYQARNQYAAAEPLYQRALAIREKAQISDLPTTRSRLNPYRLHRRQQVVPTE